MCGFAGLWQSDVEHAESPAAAAERMVGELRHRGPDDRGQWEDAEAGVGLAFRRLAILDLSSAGHQPMQSASGRYVIAFNGEVFNFRSLREELAAGGDRFRGHSDTEVMLAAFDRWGIAEATKRFVGMFAFAVWDRGDRSLTLCRDRLGIKPLFYAWTRAGLLFGSELKAILAHPAAPRQVDRDALVQYLRYLYVPAPASMLVGVNKLPPGHLVTVRAPQHAVRPDAYWSVHDVAAAGRADPLVLPDEEALDLLDRTLREVVGLRMIADVPLGALLSGGVDSSLVVALMQSLSTRPTRTFTIGFDATAHNESVAAARVASHLGTDHTTLRMTGAEALDVIPNLATMFDEPLADPSHIPTFLVSRLARQHVTVALSGDGGDEMFGGYNRYVHGAPTIERLTAVPAPLRRTAGKLLGVVPDRAWRLIGGAGAGSDAGADLRRLPVEKARKLCRLLMASDPVAMYKSLLSATDDPASFVTHGADRPGVVDATLRAATPTALADRMMLADQATYLADDLLAKVDRASMAVSLEARVPLLDHRLVELAWRLPLAQKIRDGRGKWPLRQLLSRYVPQALVDRPKVGFSVPLAEWLRGPLRDWAESLLAPEALRRDGILEPAAVRRQWTAFTSGRDDLALSAWALLQYRDWWESWRPTP